jgi:hypothetical protein
MALTGILLPSVFGSQAVLPKDHLGHPATEIHGVLEEKVDRCVEPGRPDSVAVPHTVAGMSLDGQGIQPATVGTATLPPRAAACRMNARLFHIKQPPSNNPAAPEGAPLSLYGIVLADAPGTDA